MRITANLKDVFVPKFNDNRDLPEGEQITVEIKRPSMAQRSNLKSVRMTQGGDFSFGYNADRILRQNVGKITNLESEVNGKTFVIMDGKTLADDTNPALEPLVTEICMEVTGTDTLDDDEVKN